VADAQRPAAGGEQDGREWWVTHPSALEAIFRVSAREYDWKGCEAALLLMAKPDVDPHRADLLHQSMRLAVANGYMVFPTTPSEQVTAIEEHMLAAKAKAKAATTSEVDLVTEPALERARTTATRLEQALAECRRHLQEVLGCCAPVYPEYAAAEEWLNAHPDLDAVVARETSGLGDSVTRRPCDQWLEQLDRKAEEASRG
jgi:hypothetical protein